MAAHWPQPAHQGVSRGKASRIRGVYFTLGKHLLRKTPVEIERDLGLPRDPRIGSSADQIEPQRIVIRMAKEGSRLIEIPGHQNKLAQKNIYNKSCWTAESQMLGMSRRSNSTRTTNSNLYRVAATAPEPLLALKTRNLFLPGLSESECIPWFPKLLYGHCAVSTRNPTPLEFTALCKGTLKPPVVHK